MKIRANAVFEGGEIALVGAVCYLEQMGYGWRKLAGTSAGAITAALLAAGYSGREVANLVQHQNFTEFQDCGCWRRLPKIGPALSLIFRLGICLHQDLPERHGLVGREIDFKSILSGITCPGEQYGKAGYTEVGKEVVVFETVQGIRNQPVYKG